VNELPPVFRARCAPLLAACLATGLLCSASSAVADVPATSSGAATVLLERGDRGPAVERLQSRLSVSPVDGIFGRITERAVRRFQRRNRLVADGIVGPLTRRALGLKAFSADSVETAEEREPESDVRLPRVLRRIAKCESGGNPRAVSPGGRYRGKFQFSRGTWRDLGGRGDPIDASESTQDRLALKLYRESGTTPWPACSKR